MGYWYCGEYYSEEDDIYDEDRIMSSIANLLDAFETASEDSSFYIPSCCEYDSFYDLYEELNDYWMHSHDRVMPDQDPNLTEEEIAQNVHDAAVEVEDCLRTTLNNAEFFSRKYGLYNYWLAAQDIIKDTEEKYLS